MTRNTTTLPTYTTSTHTKSGVKKLCKWPAARRGIQLHKVMFIYRLIKVYNVLKKSALFFWWFFFSNQATNKSVLELITDLYQEEDSKECQNDVEDLDPKMRKLNQETTQGLITGQVGYRVRSNNKFSCPFCTTEKKEGTYKEVLVHAHRVTTDSYSTQEERMRHRVLIEYLMWSTELVQERNTLGI
jgi:hypothetical protein